MQSAYTIYIFGLNMVLAGFSDQAVTALGLYYKWQTFFFIPLGAMQTCMVPIISYNYASHDIPRCRDTLVASLRIGLCLMALGTLCFVAIPVQLLNVFTSDPIVIDIGKFGFPLVGISFLPMVTSLIFPVFFQSPLSKNIVFYSHYNSNNLHYLCFQNDILIVVYTHETVLLNPCFCLL